MKKGWFRLLASSRVWAVVLAVAFTVAIVGCSQQCGPNCDKQASCCKDGCSGKCKEGCTHGDKPCPHANKAAPDKPAGEKAGCPKAAECNKPCPHAKKAAEQKADK
jgi:hypothetical protein